MTVVPGFAWSAGVGRRHAQSTAACGHWRGTWRALGAIARACWQLDRSHDDGREAHRDKRPVPPSQHVWPRFAMPARHQVSPDFVTRRTV
jgi:hypothetical protein